MSKERFIAVAVLATLAAAAYAQGDVVQFLPGQIPWKDVPPAVAKNAKAAVLAGPLDKPVLYTQRVRLAPGGTIMPHTHPDTRYTTVLSGVLYVGVGDNFDPARATRYPAGSFVVMPAGTPHYVLAKKGAVVYQESGVGPTGASVVKK